MRDAVIDEITARMSRDKRIFFLSADFGAPSLDALVQRFPDRFINVGIAEQNLINVATGLSLEGYSVFAYGIAPFVSMRCLEQLRTHFSLLGHFLPPSVCVIGVGSGYSYDLSGPSHQTLEDVSVVRALPGVTILNPCDIRSAVVCVGTAIRSRKPTYLRLDGKPAPQDVTGGAKWNARAGYRRVAHGQDAAIVATGSMTDVALQAGELLARQGTKVTVIDLFDFSNFDEKGLCRALRGFNVVATCSEGFLRRGDLDTIVLHVLARNRLHPSFVGLGVANDYVFTNLSREDLQKRAGLTPAAVASGVRKALRKL